MSKAGKSDSKGYLVCSECGGYYKLKKVKAPLILSHVNVEVHSNIMIP